VPALPHYDAFEGLPLGPAGQLAVLAGAMVEDGADPARLVEHVVAGAGMASETAAEFVTAWRELVGEQAALPEPVEEQEAFNAAQAALVRPPGRSPWRRGPEGVSEEEAYLLAEGWFSLSAWALPLNTLLQLKEVRVALPLRQQLTEAIGAVAPLRSDLACAVGLLAVLDDERLVVLHRPTARGFEVTISGIGDNFQLHTLLAAALSGPAAEGLLEGVRPDPSWVAAATDGPFEPPGGPIAGQFNLVDAYGQWIWNEGRPADIPTLEGRLVVVLDPPPYERTWNIGRTYPMMRPYIHLDRIMPADEAAGWLGRVATPAPPAARSSSRRPSKPVDTGR